MALSSNLDGFQELPKLPPMSAEDFRRRYAATLEPVCIRGAIDDWPALGRWSPSSLVDRFGDREVSAFTLRDGDVQFDPQSGFVLRHLALRDYVDACEKGGPPSMYLSVPLPGRYPELSDEIRPLPYAEGGLMPRTNLWLAYPDTQTRMHTDNPHNIIAMISGKKRFMLAPFGQRKNLYPHPLWSVSPQFVSVDPEHPDLERFPRLAHARGWDVTLEAGDILYIPPRVYHYARAIDTSLSLNFWWNDWKTASLVRIAKLAKVMRGIDV